MYVEDGVQTMYTDRTNRDRQAKLSKGVMPDQLVWTGVEHKGGSEAFGWEEFRFKRRADVE